MFELVFVQIVKCICLGVDKSVSEKRLHPPCLIREIRLQEETTEITILDTIKIYHKLNDSE